MGSKFKVQSSKFENRKPLPLGEVGGNLPVRAHGFDFPPRLFQRRPPSPARPSPPLPEGEVFHHSPLTTD
jgi:hypothetical protein